MVDVAAFCGRRCRSLCLVLLLIAVGIDERNEGVKFFFGLLAFLVGVVGAACVLITLIRFVRWVW